MVPGARGDENLKDLLGIYGKHSGDLDSIQYLRSTPDYIENDTISVSRRNKHLPLFQANRQLYNEACTSLFANHSFRFDIRNHHWSSAFLNRGFLSRVKSCHLEPTALLPSDVIWGFGSSLEHLTLIWDFSNMFFGWEAGKAFAKVFVHMPHLTGLKSLKLVVMDDRPSLYGFEYWRRKFAAVLHTTATLYPEDNTTSPIYIGLGNWVDTNCAQLTLESPDPGIRPPPMSAMEIAVTAARKKARDLMIQMVQRDHDRWMTKQAKRNRETAGLGRQEG
jgi:hypothetical protein